VTSPPDTVDIEQGRHPRVGVSLEIELKAEGQGAPLRTPTSDVGLGGCYVEMMFTLAVGSCVGLTLWLGRQKWRTRAEVVMHAPVIFAFSKAMGMLAGFITSHRRNCRSP
jgi:hypothetical protein